MANRKAPVTLGLGLLKLQERMQWETMAGWRERNHGQESSD